MDNRIELKFDKATTRLAGNPYGKSVYNEQVKEKIDFSRVNVIYFPDNIEKIASSFVQGFFSEIINKIGFHEVESKIIIETKREGLRDEIFRDLFA